MTSKVTINACCSEDRVVLVKIFNGPSNGAWSVLENEDEYECYIHGDLKVVVREITKVELAELA